MKELMEEKVFSHVYFVGRIHVYTTEEMWSHDPRPPPRGWIIMRLGCSHL